MRTNKIIAGVAMLTIWTFSIFSVFYRTATDFADYTDLSIPHSNNSISSDLDCINNIYPPYFVLCNKENGNASLIFVVLNNISVSLYNLNNNTISIMSIHSIQSIKYVQGIIFLHQHPFKRAYNEFIAIANLTNLTKSYFSKKSHVLLIKFKKIFTKSLKKWNVNIKILNKLNKINNVKVKSIDNDNNNNNNNDINLHWILNAFIPPHTICKWWNGLKSKFKYKVEIDCIDADNIDVDDDGILPLNITINAELPILAHMICDEGYNIDKNIEKINSWKYRSCLFSNYSMCYNFNSNEWIYYTKIDVFGYDINGELSKLKLPLKLKGVIKKLFPSKTVKSWERDTFNERFSFSILYEHKHRNNKILMVDDEWTMYGMFTKHTNNIGHILFETYWKIFKAIDNFINNGIILDEPKINLVVENAFSGPLLPKFRNAFEPILFNKVEFLSNYTQIYKNKYDEMCFKNIVIGAGEYSALLQALHINNHLIRYLRKKILNYFNLNELYKPNKISILVLHKTMSYWGRDEVITNFNEVFENMKKRYFRYNVLCLDPTKKSIAEQVEMFWNSSIIISPMGGIGYMNFLQPLNGIQIYLVCWGLFERYLPKNYTETFIPENDHEVHNQQNLQTILKYVDLSTKYNYTANKHWAIKQRLLFSVVDKAIKIIKQRFDIHTS